MNCVKYIGLLVITATIVSGQVPKPLVRGVNSPTTSATANGASFAPVISSTGRYIAFSSLAKDLVPGQTNSLNLDVFLRDMVRTAPVAISVRQSGSLNANGNSSYPVVSRDGRYVAFISAASNITAQTGGPCAQVFVRDTLANSTHMESVDASGKPGGQGSVTDCDMTPDAKYLLIVSSQFLTDATFGFSFSQLYLRDRLAQSNRLITFRATNATYRSIGNVDSPGFSTNGQRIVYSSAAADLIVWPGSVPTKAHSYFFDTATQTNACLSLDAQSVLGGIPQASSNVVISGDGSAVAFIAISNTSFLIYESLASRQPQIVATNIDVTTMPQLSTSGTLLLYRSISNGTTNVSLWNVQTATAQTINVATDLSVNGDSIPCGMSGDGSRVVFLSNSTNLTSEVANGLYQIYVRDTIAATTRLVSVTASGPAPTSQRHSYSSISEDGSRVVFASGDSSFVADDNNHNNDVFVWSWATGEVQLVSAKDPACWSDTDFGGVLPAPYAVSSNGQYVAFTATDGGTVANDTNNFPDVFVRNMTSGQSVLCGANANGTFATNGSASYPAISADGRFVAFIKNTNGTGLGFGDVFFQDLQSSIAKLISTNSSGVPVGNANTSAISADGRYVGFQTTSAIVASDSNGKSDIYMYDSTGGTNSIISAPGVGLPASYDSSNAVFSPNGAWLVFQSSSPYMAGSNLGTTNVQLYARHIGNDGNVLVSGTTQSPYMFNCSNAVFSADSEVLAFNTGFNGGPAIATHNFSNGSNQFVVYNAINPSLNRDGTKIAYNTLRAGALQIYVQNIGSTQSNLVSVGADGVSLSKMNCSAPTLTPDGRFVVFTGTGFNFFVANDTNSVVDIYVRDLVLSNTFAITGPGSAVPNLGAVNPVVSADGRTIVFQSFSTDLNTNILTANRNLFVAKIVVGDSDHDGLDDDWEMTYFGDLSHDGTVDSDGDGLTDLQEFLAGTNPIDNSSVLRCLTVVTSGGGATVYWSAVAGRAYRIEYKDSVDDLSWKTLVSSTIAGAQSASVADPDGSLTTQRFYRVTALP